MIPRMLITAPPPLPTARLLGRDAIDTCGYINGDAALPITCPGRYTCSDLFLANHWACCDKVSCLDSYKACANFGQRATQCSLYSTGANAAYCSSEYSPILTCPSDSSICVTYTMFSSLGHYDTTYSYGCDTVSRTVIALVNATGSGAGPVQGTGPGTWIGTLPSIAPLGTETETGSGSTPTLSAGGVTSTGTARPTGSSGTSTTTSSSSSSHSSSWYQWVGLAIGLFVLFGIVLGCIRRYRKRREMNRQLPVQPYYPPQPLSQPPPTGPPYAPPTGPPYAPPQSMSSPSMSGLPPPYSQAMNEPNHGCASINNPSEYNPGYARTGYNPESGGPMPEQTDLSQHRRTADWASNLPNQFGREQSQDGRSQIGPLDGRSDAGHTYGTYR